jgi:endonuclease-8
MPEGDFVRRVVRRLDEALTGEPLTYTLLRWPTLGGIDLTGQTITSIDAYGKHILMHLSDRRTLRTHLRMDGTYYIERAADGRPAPGSRAERWTSRAVLATREWVGIGHRLGMADLVRTRDVRRLLGHLGPDIMADGFDADQVGAAITAQGERMIGATLLDQTIVAGIGTIYLAEGLFEWRVRPSRASGQVPDPAGLLEYIRGVLWRSVRARTGTATGDTRRGLTTLAHGREHRPCRRCRTPIEVLRVGPPPLDRPAFYCPVCQPD